MARFIKLVDNEGGVSLMRESAINGVAVGQIEVGGSPPTHPWVVVVEGAALDEVYGSKAEALVAAMAFAKDLQ
jgi:hypothetical protein